MTNLINKILVSQSLYSKGEWIITTPDLYPFFKDKTKSQYQFNTFNDALEFISGRETKDINIVCHGSKEFLELGKGYTTIELERELSNKNNHNALFFLIRRGFDCLWKT